MISRFPVVRRDRENQGAEKEMEVIMDVITAVRNIRGEMRISPSQKLKALISCPDEIVHQLMKTHQHYIMNLANLELLDSGINIEEPKGVATSVLGSLKIFIPLFGVVDIAGEKNRLTKELSKVSKDLEQSSRKLANRDF